MVLSHQKVKKLVKVGKLLSEHLATQGALGRAKKGIWFKSDFQNWQIKIVNYGNTYITYY